MMKLLYLKIASVLVIGVSSRVIFADYEVEKKQQPKCYEHYQLLNEEWIGIIYGRVAQCVDCAEMRSRQFPYSNKVAYGGCVILT